LSRLQHFVRISRPANVVTAFADILAGASLGISSFQDFSPHSPLQLGLLLVTSACLYAGGIVFNDVFDFELDKKERPERILPRGLISLKDANYFGILLFLIALLFSGMVHASSFFLTILLIILVLLYDKYAKHHIVAGPLVMGLCRSTNLLLGLSFVGEALFTHYFIAIIPMVFIAGVTITSRGENIGNNRKAISLALLFDTAVVGLILWYQFRTIGFNWIALPFLGLWYLMNVNAKVKAIKTNEPKIIMKAVKTGVLSVIPLNACHAAAYGFWPFALVILVLLPVSISLAKKYAVT
jgi:4-hydroxybenzoate polyprenyltransferase